jgi:hypothetical protein
LQPISNLSHEFDDSDEQDEDDEDAIEEDDFDPQDQDQDAHADLIRRTSDVHMED